MTAKLMEGKVVLVTGGASGIGAASAELLAENGAIVAIGDLNFEGAKTVSAKICAAGYQAHAFHLDVSQEESVKSFLNDVVKKLGTFSGALNNVGIPPKPGPITSIERANWDRVLAVDVTGVMLCLKHEFSHMIENGGGAIVNMSSNSGIHGTKNFCAYSAAKHAVNGITKTAALEGVEHSIRVNAICPSAVDTAGLLAAVAAGLDHKATINAAAGRNAAPVEIAHAAMWLLSDGASFVNGACLSVDGGANAA